MKITNSRQILAVFTFASVFMILSACSSSSASVKKQTSLWDQRKGVVQDTVSLSTDEYTQEAGQNSAVDLGYQADLVDSAVPVEEEPFAAGSVEASVVVEPESMSPEEEILSKPVGYYTVQVMASVDVDRVYKFAEQNQIPVRYIVPTVRDGVAWHVLLLDIYPDIESAKAGLNEIADSLKTQPWIRNLESVQKQMN